MILTRCILPLAWSRAVRHTVALTSAHPVRLSRVARVSLCVVAALALHIARGSLAEAQRPAGPPAVLVSRPMASPPPDSIPVVRESLTRQSTPPAIEGLPRRLPIVILQEQYLVVASTTWSHDWAVRQDTADTDLLRCAVTLGVPQDTVRAFLNERPWHSFDEEVEGSPYVLFQAMANDNPTATCAQPRLHDPRYLQRGIVLTTASLLNAAHNVRDVDVFGDTTFRSPTIYGRVAARATEWFRAPDAPLARPRSVGQVRVYLPMDALDPYGGRFPSVGIRVWNSYLKLVTVPVPSSVSRQLWYELVPWRLDRLRGAVPAGTADVPGVPAPNDAGLRALVQRYRRGEVVDAAEQAAVWRTLDRAKSGGDTTHEASLRHDRLIADVLVGGVLAAAGDTVAATPFADDALATAPCLVPTTPAAGAYRRLLSSRRPSGRCAGLPLSKVARSGLVVPGGGHSVAGDKGLAVAAASAVAVTLGAAALARVAASHRYDHYQEATSVESAEDRYASAAAMRNLGIGLAVGSAAIWLADMGYAVMREKRRTERIRGQATYGREQCHVPLTQGCSR